MCLITYSCHVVAHLCCSARDDNSAVAFVYCDYASKAQQSANNLLRALLSQLITHLSPESKVIKELQYQYTHGYTLTHKLTMELLTEVATSSQLKAIWLCADALDELGGEEQDAFLHALSMLCKHHIFHVFLTGRFVVEARVKHRIGTDIQFFAITTTSNLDDIDSFLKHELSKDLTPGAMKTDLWDTIFEYLAGKTST